jgi:hypothetical protein
VGLVAKLRDVFLAGSRRSVALSQPPHVLAQIPEDKMNMQCQVRIEQPIALSRLVDRYIAHCEDITGQILAHL